MSKSRLNDAYQQLFGYAFGKGTGWLPGLLEGMGVTKKEWEKLKIDYDISNFVSEDDMKDVEEYFNTKDIDAAHIKSEGFEKTVEMIENMTKIDPKSLHEPFTI